MEENKIKEIHKIIINLLNGLKLEINPNDYFYFETRDWFTCLAESPPATDEIGERKKENDRKQRIKEH